MAYQNVSFPTLKLVHTFRAETIAPTVILSNFATEYRINRYSQAKNRFVAPARNVRNSDWLTLKGFFDSVGWQRDSFNFTRPDTGEVVKVRLDSLPTATIVAVDSSNNPTIMSVSDIVLIQVFNE